ncbi:MAG TPA: c-type cytochrome domain-containing protein, partial [Luteolibacter sp.]|nr:c-type cytochrome domain-containing protein [Luteolibacter sp.]
MMNAKFPAIATLACLVLPWGLVSCRPEGNSAVAESSTDADASAGLPETVTFNAHIRPILSDSCFACHGFDANTREAGLRLDTPEGAYAALKDSDSKFAIVPGDPDGSEVLARITTQDPDLQMPPPTFHKDPLDAREVALVRRWIEQGAKYENHWSFEPVRRVEPPVPAKHAEQVANPIDAFVLDRLAREDV